MASCELCGGTGVFATECCSGAYGCSCKGGMVDVPCTCIGGRFDVPFHGSGPTDPVMAAGWSRIEREAAQVHATTEEMLRAMRGENSS